MSTATPVPADEVPVVDTRTTLTANDRCDRCGAQAYVATGHVHSDLLWCAHCFRPHATTLALQVVVDERHKLA